ncbi:MAG: MBL fold metallo-hydrolase [Candidatus Nitrosocaldaceae archaeon]
MSVTHIGDFQNIISVYLINKRVLIDPGTYSIAEDVLHAIKSNHVHFDDIRYIILTHLHLDHSGNTWYMLKHIPNAKVIISSKGAKYLIDPTQLIASSRSVLGSIVDRWGEVRAIESEKIIGIDDNYTLDIDGSSIRFIETPGHAPYHFSALLDDVLFTGDAVGIKVKDRLRPASPLPSFRLDLALQSIKKIKGLRVKRLYTPHFGIVDDVDNFLDENILVYKRWEEIIKQGLNDGKDEQEILTLINKEFGYDELLKDEFISMLLRSDLRGFIKYLKK